jgi:hypothetical protein
VKLARIFPLALSFTCVFLVFPFGVFAPATIASTAFVTREEKLEDPVDYTYFAEDRQGWY